MIVLSIIIIIHINIISIYSLLHVLSNVVARDATVNCRGILSFSLYTCLIGSTFSPSRKKNDLVLFPRQIILLCYIVYIHNVYKHMSNIYIIHIYFRPSHVSSRLFFLSLSLSLSHTHILSSSILIYRPYL